MAWWNNKPIESGEGSPAKKGGGILHADSVKCPSCASNIIYEPEIGGMLCRNCGGVFSVDNLEPRGSFGINKEHDYFSDEDISEDDKKRHEIVCNSCGATLVTDENTMSTMCPFCGSPALITKRMTREFKPDYIIPFKVDKNRAQSIMKEWLAGRKYTPRGFRSKSRLSKMTALYVPFWLLDCCVNTELSGTGKSDGMACEVNSKIKYYVKGVPFDASLNIANKLMQAVEPFDYSEMVKFENKYLQGFYANKYDQLPTEMTDRMIKRLEKYSLSANDMIAKKYHGYEPHPEKDYSYLSEISVKYCLLPVWFMTVEFGGRQYCFAVNGQTGEASGQVPTSDGADLYDRIINKTNGSINMTVPSFLMAALAVLIILLVLKSFSSGVNTFSTIVIVSLCVCEGAILIFCLLNLILRYIHKRRSSGRGVTAYEINDYDKAPDLETYFDPSRKTDFEIKEIPLYYAHLLTNDNGEILGELSDKT